MGTIIKSYPLNQKTPFKKNEKKLLRAKFRRDFYLWMPTLHVLFWETKIPTSLALLPETDFEFSTIFTKTIGQGLSTQMTLSDWSPAVLFVSTSQTQTGYFPVFHGQMQKFI